MSFILEALRKSEAERRAAPTAKGVAAGVYVVAQPRRRRSLTLLVPLAALAAGVGIAVGWGALPGERSASALTVVPPVAPTAQVATSAPLDTGQSMPAAASAASNVVSSAGEAKAVPPPQAALPAAVAVVRPPVKTVVAASAAAPSAPAAAAVSNAPSAAPVRPRATGAGAIPATAPVSAPVVSPVPAAPGQVVAAAPAAAPAAVQATVQATVQAAAAVPDAVSPAAADEPPRLHVSGFANADDTRERFAVIDNRIVREGEIFAPDLRLVQVGDDGVVVEYKGRRYRP